MSDNGYQIKHRLADKEDGKLRRVWFAPATATHVKTHTTRIGDDLATQRWRITAAICDENGKASTDGATPALIEHHFQVEAEERARPRLALDGTELPAPTHDELAQKMQADFLAAHRFAVMVAEEAALKARVALTL